MVRKLLAGFVLAAAASAPAFAQDTVRASVDSSGNEGDDNSTANQHCVADDGKSTLVVFTSRATNLVTGDNNGKFDVFLRDVTAGTTQRIVLDVNGGEPDGDSTTAGITPDGRFVVFQSSATDLVAGDKNGVRDVFVLDRKSGVIERVSLDENGREADANSDQGRISDDGRYVLFDCVSDQLVGGDTNGRIDCFLRDRTAQTTVCVSHNPSGKSGDGTSGPGDISGDGSTIAFTSGADDLVANDLNFTQDIFVYDVKSGNLALGTVNEGGFQLDGSSLEASLSADGGLLAFRSIADNAHRDATNGQFQIFVRDLATGTIWLASRAVDGAVADDHSFTPYLFTREDASGDRVKVAYWSLASNLPDGGTSDFDAFVFDLDSGVVQCATVDSAGVPHSSSSGSTSGFGASPDGRQLAFSTLDDKLVAGDGNGKTDVFLRGLQWTSFAEFGTGLAGSGGFVPHLSGTGGWCEDSIWGIALEDGLGRAAGHLWVGFGRTNGLPLFGGNFYVDFAQPLFPIPIQLGGFAGVSGSGSLTIGGPNVEELGGFSVYLQCTLLDPHAPRGVSLTNALEFAIDAP